MVVIFILMILEDCMYPFSQHRRKNSLILIAGVLVLLSSFLATVLSGVDAKSNIAQPSTTKMIFPPADNVIGLFEFDGSLRDSSGHGRDLTLIGGSIVPSFCRSGLRVEQVAQAGVQWNAYASLLQHPYTIEMVLTPEDTTQWRKLFGADPTQDAGWYYKNNGLQSYPSSVVGAGKVQANRLHYIAFVSTSPTTIDIYFQGELLGSTDAHFTAPPSHVIFFQDDSAVPRENFSGIVEGLRISSVSRTAEEIAAVQSQLSLGGCDHQVFLPFVHSIRS
jgi:hypothetical protein